MAKTGVCVVAVILVVIVTVQSARLKRSEYLFDNLQDASIAGDYILGIGPDCSDDDSSESIELGYVIINKREAPENVLSSNSQAQVAPASSTTGSSSQPLPLTKPVSFV